MENQEISSVEMSEKEIQEKIEELDIKKIIEYGKIIFEKEFATGNLNILVLGKTGVGKSTLINAVFGEEVAKTGSGKSVTQNFDAYKHEFGVIYDSKGIEAGNRETVEKVREFIEERRKGTDEKEQIHIAWLCILEKNRRIENVDEEFYKILKEFKIPTIVCITQAEADKDKDGNKFSDIVKETLKIKDEKDCIRIRALEVEDDEGDIKPLRGIQTETKKDGTKIIGIKDRTKELLPEAQQNAFIRISESKVEQASIIATRYALAAATTGATPVPFSDIALILPTQSAMIVHISKIYGFDFDVQSGKKIIVALIGVFGAGLLTRRALASAIKFIPGVGSVIGGAINAAVAFGVTKAIGELYSKCLHENYDKYLDNIDIDKLIPLVKTYMSNQEIQKIVGKFIKENLLSKISVDSVSDAIREAIKKFS